MIARSFKFGVAALAASAIGFVVPADASSVSAAPNKPSLTIISAKSRVGKIDVTVVFARASTNPKSPLLSTLVKVGTRTCVATQRATRCTVKGLSSGKSYRVSARARNKNGWGSWSAPASFFAKAGRTWRREATAPTLSTLVAPTSSTSIAGGNSNTNLRLNLDGSVALGVTESSVASSSIRKNGTDTNLRSIDQNGRISNPVIQGSAQISRILVAPNDQIYLVFKSREVIDNSDCIIARLERISGEVSCIETDVNFLPTSSPKSYTNFKFDAEGSMYYVGSPKRNQIGASSYYPDWRQGTDLVVRRVKNGVQKDFGVAGDPNIALESNRIDQEIQNFFVTPEGFIVVDQSRGLTSVPCPASSPSNAKCSNGNGYVFHVYSPNGDRLDVSNCRSLCSINGSNVRNAVTLMSQMADGRILVGYGLCLCILDPNSWSFDDRAWYSALDRTTDNGPPVQIPSEYYSASDCPSGNGSLFTRRFVAYFCNWGANKWNYSWTTPEGKTFAVVGSRNECFMTDCRSPITDSYLRDCCWTGILTQIFPVFEPTSLGGNIPNRELENIDSYVAVLSQFVASGSTPSGGYRTIIYDTNSKNVRELIPEVDGIRVDEMIFSASKNSVLFLGVRQVDGKKITGVIDLSRSSYRAFPVSEGNLQGLVSLDG